MPLSDFDFPHINNPDSANQLNQLKLFRSKFKTFYDEADSLITSLESRASALESATVTKSDVGLGNVSNYGDASQSDAETGTASDKFMTPQRTKQAIDKQRPGPCVLKDIKSHSTKGGTFTAGAWRTRDINTIENDQDWISLASNQFTLLAGKYLIEASAPAYRVDSHMVALYNTTASTLVTGSSEYSYNAGQAQTRSVVRQYVELSADATFELRHYCQTTRSDTGLGVSCTFSGISEEYSQVTIWKVG